MSPDVNPAPAHADDKTHDRIHQNAESIKQKTHDTNEKVESVADRAEQRIHRAADRAAEWRERGSAAVSDARDRASDILDHGRGWVREKPVESVVIALAAGWLIGRLLSSRR